MAEEGLALFGSREEVAGLCEHKWPVCYRVCFCKINILLSMLYFHVTRLRYLDSVIRVCIYACIYVYTEVLISP